MTANCTLATDPVCYSVGSVLVMIASFLLFRLGIPGRRLLVGGPRSIGCAEVRSANQALHERVALSVQDW